MSGDSPLARLLAAVEPSQLLVATDFDGTLSEIVPEPADARPLPGALEALRSLKETVKTVAVLSGRSPAALRELVPLEGILLLGDYGRAAPTGSELAALQSFNAAAAEIVSRFSGVRLETKPASTSIHYRDRPESGPAVFAELAPLARAHGLDVRRGRMVVEVLPGGWDKARALGRLVEETRPAGVVFAGDDYGDRRCFEYLRSLDVPHLAVGVASAETPPEVFEACDLVVEGPAAAVELFRRLAREATRRRSRGRADREAGGSASD